MKMEIIDKVKTLMKSGDVAGAEALCRKALEADPDNAEIKMRYGICRELLGDEKTFKKIHDELAPEMTEAEKTEPRSEKVSLWRKYHKLWTTLIVGALVLGGAAAGVVCFGKSIREQFEAMIHATSAYAGPKYEEPTRSGENRKTQTMGRQIQYEGAAPGFRYIGADLDDSAIARRTFAWFDDDGTKEASFSLTLPRNADRLVETDAGKDYVRPVELLVAEYPRKPFLHLWASGYPVSYWPSPETLPYARRVGKFRDGADDLLVYSVAREEVAGKPMLHGSDFGFDGVLLYAREVPEAKGLRMRVTDMVARKTLPDKAELNNALDDLRRHWTSGPGSKVIGNLFMERVTPAIRRQSLLVWEDNRTGVFAHWENAESGGFVLYMILTDKWGYKGGVNRRVHGNTVTAAAKAESPLSALVRGAKESNRELVAEALAKGANPNGSIEQNITPLGASIDGLVTPNIELLRLLLEAGADPNRLWGNSGTTPFYSIVQSSCWGRKTQEELAAYSEGIRLMLKHGADPNRKQGRFGHSPLSYAVMRGADLSIVKILVEEGGGVVTDNLIESAKDNSELLDYLRSKKTLP